VLVASSAAIAAMAAKLAIAATPTAQGRNGTMEITRNGSRASGKGPAVSESRSFYESFSVQPPSTDKLSADRCAVGFWNLTGRDVTLSVDGKPQIIPQGKSLKLQLGRQFVWQIGGHDAQTEKVPMENSGVEIVLRRQ